MSETAEKNRGGIITGALRMTRCVFSACWSTALLAVMAAVGLDLPARIISTPALLLFDSAPRAAAWAVMSAGIGICLWLLWAYLFLCFLATAKGSVAWDALARGERLTAKEVSAVTGVHRRSLRQLAARVLAKFLRQVALTLAGVAAGSVALAVVFEKNAGFGSEAVGEVILGAGLFGTLVVLVLCWLKIRVDTALAAVLIVRDLCDTRTALAAARLWVVGRRLRFFFAQAGLYVLGGIVTAVGIFAVVAPAMSLDVLAPTFDNPANLRLGRMVGLGGLLAAMVVLVQVVIKVAVSLLPVTATVHWPPPGATDGSVPGSSRGAHGRPDDSRPADPAPGSSGA